MKYRTLWVVDSRLPDDRLANATVEVRDGQALVVVTLREGMVHEDFVDAMARYSMSVALTGAFEIELDHLAMPAELQAWFQPVGDRLTGRKPFEIFFGGHGPKFFEILVNENIIRKEVVKELNHEAMPTVCGLMVPAKYARRKTESDEV